MAPLALSTFLTAELERRKLTPLIVAARGGLSVDTVQKLARGLRGWRPTERVLDGLAKGLGCDRFELYTMAGRLPEGVDPHRAAQALRRVART